MTEPNQEFDDLVSDLQINDPTIVMSAWDINKFAMSLSETIHFIQHTLSGFLLADYVGIEVPPDVCALIDAVEPMLNHITMLLAQQIEDCEEDD